MTALGLDGLVNARDLGGLAVVGGGAIAAGRLYRSETPQLLTEAGRRRAVDEFGMARVIDLRGARGRGSGPLGDDGRGVVIDFFDLIGGIDTVDTSAEGFLPSLVDQGGVAVARVLELVVEAPGPSLVHCHTGKDRTGFVVAVILAFLGVADDDIVADYDITSGVFQQMMANLDAAGMGVPAHAAAYAREAPSPEGIAKVLARLGAEWPSPEQYLLDLGADPAVLAAARRLLLA